MLSVQNFIINRKYLMILKDGTECIVVCTYTDHRKDVFNFFESEVGEEQDHRIFNTRTDNNILDILEIRPLFENIDQLFYN